MNQEEQITADNAAQHIHLNILNWEAALKKGDRTQEYIDNQIQGAIHINIKAYLKNFDGSSLHIEILKVLFDCASVPSQTVDGKTLNFKERTALYCLQQ